MRINAKPFTVAATCAAVIALGGSSIAAAQPSPQDKFLTQVHALHAYEITTNQDVNLIDLGNGICQQITTGNSTPAGQVKDLTAIAWTPAIADKTVAIAISTICPKA